MQFYFDVSRESDPNALPDGEVFFSRGGEWETEEGEPNEAGWYWFWCFPGCLPESEPCGPFETSDEALEDARSYAQDMG
jgi:hypothetical protein